MSRENYDAVRQMSWKMSLIYLNQTSKNFHDDDKVMDTKTLADKSQFYFKKSQEADAHLKQKQPIYYERYKFKTPEQFRDMGEEIQ